MSEFGKGLTYCLGLFLCHSGTDYYIPKMDKKTKDILGKIVGWGKDSFNEIIKNDIKIYMASGDSFCEIIRKKLQKKNPKCRK